MARRAKEEKTRLKDQRTADANARIAQYRNQGLDYVEGSIAQGKLYILSLEDADLLQYKWHLDEGYVKRWITNQPKYKKVRQHVVVLERILGRSLQPGEEGDHVNGIPHDNRRGNLRVASHTQNQWNRKMNANNTSGYRGVSKYGQKWLACIRINGKTKHLGLFDTPEDASERYEAEADKEFGGRKRCLTKS